jgi:hypothetical protein
MSDPIFRLNPRRKRLLIQLRRIIAGHASDEQPGASAEASVRALLLPTQERQLTRQRVLEDLLRELLQPMIQRWLDENLESLVSRVAREETAQTRRVCDEAQYESFAATIVSLVLRKKRRSGLGDRRCS